MLNSFSGVAGLSLLTSGLLSAAGAGFVSSDLPPAGAALSFLTTDFSAFSTAGFSLAGAGASSFLASAVGLAFSTGLPTLSKSILPLIFKPPTCGRPEGAGTSFFSSVCTGGGVGFTGSFFWTGVGSAAGASAFFSTAGLGAGVGAGLGFGAGGGVEIVVIPAFGRRVTVSLFFSGWFSFLSASAFSFTAKSFEYSFNRALYILSSTFAVGLLSMSNPLLTRKSTMVLTPTLNSFATFTRRFAIQ